MDGKVFVFGKDSMEIWPMAENPSTADRLTRVKPYPMWPIVAYGAIIGVIAAATIHAAMNGDASRMLFGCAGIGALIGPYICMLKTWSGEQ